MSFRKFRITANTERRSTRIALEKVKRRIENFGEVNPMAEEAYNEMKERFDFITAQKRTSDDSKENLLADDVRNRHTAKEQFLDTFNAVRENFITCFPEACLHRMTIATRYLENPDDPLESEIDIIAKPKGKRPQSINQISGGEKTLTALSLLFGSIYKAGTLLYFG